MSTSETFNNIKLKQINETIAKYEKNIEELQKNYDQLVEKLNLNLSLNEYEAINNDINVILTNINDNKDKLTEFKNLHKEKILNINS
jgi:flagellar biosynthesis chaperone FliJ